MLTGCVGKYRDDCNVSVFRLLDYWEFSGGAVNLTAIRTIRVLRPLRAINRIPSECWGDREHSSW